MAPAHKTHSFSVYCLGKDYFVCLTHYHLKIRMWKLFSSCATPKVLRLFFLSPFITCVSDTKPFVTINSTSLLRQGEPTSLSCALRNANNAKVIQVRWYSDQFDPVVSDERRGTIVLGNILYVREVNALQGTASFSCQVIFIFDGVADSAIATIGMERSQSNVYGIHANSDNPRVGDNLHLICETAPFATAMWLSLDNLPLRSSGRLSVYRADNLRLRSIKLNDATSLQSCASVVVRNVTDGCLKYHFESRETE